MTEFCQYTEPFEKHQLMKDYVCDLVQHSELIPIQQIERMSNCGEWLTFRENDDKLQLVGASFCRQRICPMCQWRKAERQFSNCVQIADHLTKHGYKVKKIRPVDMFPYTNHVETVVLMSRTK